MLSQSQWETSQGLQPDFIMLMDFNATLLDTPRETQHPSEVLLYRNPDAVYSSQSPTGFPSTKTGVLKGAVLL